MLSRRLCQEVVVEGCYLRNASTFINRHDLPCQASLRKPVLLDLHLVHINSLPSAPNYFSHQGSLILIVAALRI